MPPDKKLSEVVFDPPEYHNCIVDCPKFKSMQVLLIVAMSSNIIQYEEQQWVKVYREKLESVTVSQDYIKDVVIKTVQSYCPLTGWLNFKQSLFHEKCHNLLESNKNLQDKFCSDIRYELCQNELENQQASLQRTDGDYSFTVSDSDINLLKNKIEELVNEICNCIETCVLMLGLIYNKLQSEINEDICYRVVEDIILIPIWEYLILLFRCTNIEIETKIANTMKKCFKYEPNGFGLKRPLNKIALRSYADSISKLKSSSSIKSPVSKLNLFVQTIQKICENHKTDDNGCPVTPILLGADDLLPILSYVLVQTGMPHLLSECEALEQLVDQRLLLGEEGYCLTSFQMAFKYLESQSNKETFI
ncbi:VPS9 domain-containing protein 1-like [Centruroides sculpturatus]|uniref:VPS9 domain-containing protein 1-like n=1 Tax=Centruroides sculpturatus TaxID=218467 RepID=UPI000C6DC61D|nr:VPS9 domain-containing protein 1-like [Centruroides sculpturatus]